MTEPQIRNLLDESRRDYRDDSRPRPVRTYLWHPPVAGDTAPPVVLVSHGSGGSAGQRARHQVAAEAVDFFRTRLRADHPAEQTKERL